MVDTTIYAEDVNYWKTSQKSADSWIDDTCDIITSIKGEILQQAFGTMQGRAAYLLVFKLGSDVFKVSFPVLPSKTGNMKAAKVQAATILYHDVKAKVVLAKVLGTRAAFFTYLMLPDGRSAAEATTPELVAQLPKMLVSSIE